jgi:transposase
VVQELARPGVTALLAETAHQRGPKKQAKTGKADARHLRTLVAERRVPVSWIPPEQVCELRVLLQLYRDLREEHTAQRIHATLYHQSVPSLAGRLSNPQARAVLAHGEDIGLSPARRPSRPRCAGWMTWRPGSRRCTPRSLRSPRQTAVFADVPERLMSLS